MANDSNTTDWKISTDIYDIVDSVNKVKSNYIQDEQQDTLALGIFGFVTDTESKKIQTSIINTGILGNEMFPTRANLMKNVLSHATYNGIGNINATPAKIVVNIGIKIEDLDKYMKNNSFTIDSTCPIYIGSYEFHFEYDVIIKRSTVSENSFSAHYDMSEKNPLSTINQPYLKQPFVITIGNYNYMVFQATIRQYSIQTITNKFITDSVISRKTYQFGFENQLADFEVYLTSKGKQVKVTPILYGSVNYATGYYCWYQFIAEDTIRISFDNLSILPDLNSDIEIRVYNTLGSEGMFKYKTVDDTTEGIFIDLSSTKYDYNKITCYLVATTDSTDGSDAKTKAELKTLIPKYALSRGSIITETDIDNYFNLIDSDQYRLVMQKKVDNQLSRIWYSYFILKDAENNLIPTNSIKIKISTSDTSMYKSEDGRYILPCGTILSYNPETQIGTVCDESDIPELYSDEYYQGYYYMTVYNIILNPDPLYAAFYLTVSNKDSYFTFEWVNENCILQFVANRCNFKRNLLTDQSTYKFTFKIAQAIANDFGLYTKEKVITRDDTGNETGEKYVITNNMKCILVFYHSDKPYRWIEAKLTDYSDSEYISTWEVSLSTDNGLDNANNIKIKDLKVAGSNADTNYGYMEPNTKVRMYILAKFSEGQYGRYDLDDIAPGFNGYSVTNVYEVNNGIDFYENFTNILDTKVTALDNIMNEYTVTGIPCVGLHYMTSEENANYLVDAINIRKAYIDYCLDLLENNMNIDFKFFNTYGPSVMYYIGDKEKTGIGHVDINMKFRAKVTNTSDLYAKDDLISAIKEYIENIYNIGEFHAPNLISYLTEKFSSRFDYIEFMNYNNLRLGIQHISNRNLSNPHIVPEFINIRNIFNPDDETLYPDIEVEIVKE